MLAVSADPLPLLLSPVGFTSVNKSSLVISILFTGSLGFKSTSEGFSSLGGFVSSLLEDAFGVTSPDLSSLSVGVTGVVFEVDELPLVASSLPVVSLAVLLFTVGWLLTAGCRRSWCVCRWYLRCW